MLEKPVALCIDFVLLQCCYGEGQDADLHEARDGTSGQRVGSGRWSEARHVPNQQGEIKSMIYACNNVYCTLFQA